MITPIIVWALLAQADGAAWRYVVPEAGEVHEAPPLRALALSAVPPDDIVEKVAYRGAKRRYGQLRFGSPSSVRVTVVLDEFGPGRADLYVDADRNRRIEDKDRVEGKDRTWRVAVNVAMVAGELTSFAPRTVVFRLGATGLTFSHATAGYFEGTVQVGERVHKARRMDGDGNGLLADPQDQVWIDLNDDGRWDGAVEQFLFQPILALDAGRFALRGDGTGERLTLDRLEGTGTVRIALVRPEGAAPVRSLEATLIGREGSVVALSGPAAEVVIPIGEYRLGTLSLVLADKVSGPDWTFVFAAEGSRGGAKWYRVAKDATVLIDPIGTLSFETGAEKSEKALQPGSDIQVRPVLYTGDGLLIVTCYRGEPTSPAGTRAGGQVVLRDEDGQSLSIARSGFA